jgi:hypothetical protein
MVAGLSRAGGEADLNEAELRGAFLMDDLTVIELNRITMPDETSHG